jgi:hypothetical protein
MDNSSLIPYYNTQSELKVLTFGEIMYSKNVAIKQNATMEYH